MVKVNTRGCLLYVFLSKKLHIFSIISCSVRKINHGARTFSYIYKMRRKTETRGSALLYQEQIFQHTDFDKAHNYLQKSENIK